MAEKGVAQAWRRFEVIYNLIGTHCKTCDAYYFPPRLVCPACRRKAELEEYKYKGLGKIHTFSIVRQAPDDFKRQVPYAVAQVELDEGPRITAQIVNINPGDVEIGMRVRVCFRKITEYGEDGIIVYGYKFEPTMSVTGHD